MKYFIVKNFINNKICLLQGNFSITQIEIAIALCWADRGYALNSDTYEIVEIEPITELLDLENY